MQKFLKCALGAATLSLVCVCVAEAAGPRLHQMLFNLPDGSIAQVRYAGDVAPTVDIRPASASSFFAEDPLFADLDLVSAMLDRRAADMQRQAAAMLRAAVESSALPASGTILSGSVSKGVHFSYVSTMTDAHGCTRTVSYTSDGSGSAPKVTQAASGGCDAAAGKAAVMPTKTEAQAPVPTGRDGKLAAGLCGKPRKSAIILREV